jgi:hypothetical protein
LLSSKTRVFPTYNRDNALQGGSTSLRTICVRFDLLESAASECILRSDSQTRFKPGSVLPFLPRYNSR